MTIAAQHEPVTVTFGDVTVHQTWVSTPVGALPLSEVTTMTVTPIVQTTRVTPTWAIVLAVLTVWVFLLGLLFLLAKEDRVSGYVRVTVEGPRIHHACHIPISSLWQVQDISARVDYARMVAAATRPCP